MPRFDPQQAKRADLRRVLARDEGAHQGRGVMGFWRNDPTRYAVLSKAMVCQHCGGELFRKKFGGVMFGDVYVCTACKGWHAFHANDAVQERE